MDPHDAQLQLSTQRLRELTLWHGEDENNLPPPATLAHLSRDTVAALQELQRLRTHVTGLRVALSQVFWNCESSALRRVVLAALGAPPAPELLPPSRTDIGWSAAPNGLPPTRATEEPRPQPLRHAAV